MTDESTTRRPIASRDAGWAKRAATFLASKNVSPNFISVLSMVFALATLGAFVREYIAPQTLTGTIVNMILAIIGIQGRLIMNLLDGMVAVEHNKKSAVGGLFNEVPDRISDTIILFGAGIVAFVGVRESMAFDLAYLAIALSIATAYIRTLGASLNCGHHFLGPMAKQHRMALVTLGCVIYPFYQPVFYYVLIVMNIGLVITCYRRLARVYSILQKNQNPS